MITIGDRKLDKKKLDEAADVLCQAFKNDPLYNAAFKTIDTMGVSVDLLTNSKGDQ